VAVFLEEPGWNGMKNHGHMILEFRASPDDTVQLLRRKTARGIGRDGVVGKVLFIEVPEELDDLLDLFSGG
jgi:hypothetical protein